MLGRKKYMGIEGGFSVSAVEGGLAGTSPVIGPASLSLGPAFGFGRVLGFGDIGLIVNEGPVSLSDLEATMPIQTFNLNGEIKFAEHFSAEAAIAQAEAILSQVPAIPEIGPGQLIAEEVLTQAKEPLVWPYPQFIRPSWEAIIPALSPELNLESELGTKTENIFGTQSVRRAKTETVAAVEQSVVPQTALEKEIEEILVQEMVEQNPKEDYKEQEDRESRFYLEDGEAAAQRRHEIREAIIKAKLEAGRLGLKAIAGWLVAKFLPAEHPGNRSQIVKEIGPDGSLQETVDAIASVGDLRSEEEAVKRLNVIVAEKKPVKLGKEGLPVTIADVSRVLKYRIFKSVTAFEVVVKRVVKKKNPAPKDHQLDHSETNLADFPQLAEVFDKAT